VFLKSTVIVLGMADLGRIFGQLHPPNDHAALKWGFFLAIASFLDIHTFSHANKCVVCNFLM